MYFNYHYYSLFIIISVHSVGRDRKVSSNPLTSDINGVKALHCQPFS